MNTTELKQQIAQLKAEEKRLKSIQKLKEKNQAFNSRMLREYEKNPVNMIVWVWKLQRKGIFPQLSNFLTELTKLDYTLDKRKKRNHPDNYNLLSLEQGKELLYILELENLIPDSEAKYQEINNFGKKDCCICFDTKCETEMVKMRIKNDEDKYENACNCKTDICCVCIKQINKCPTCRAQFTHRSWAI